MNKTYLLKLVNDVSNEFDWVLLRLKDDTTDLIEVFNVCTHNSTVWHMCTELLKLTQMQEVITKYNDSEEIVVMDIDSGAKQIHHEFNITVIRVSGKTKTEILPHLNAIKHKLQNCTLLSLSAILMPNTVKNIFDEREFISGNALADDNTRFLTIGEPRAPLPPLINSIPRRAAFVPESANIILKIDLDKFVASHRDPNMSTHQLANLLCMNTVRLMLVSQSGDKYLQVPVDKNCFINLPK